MLVIKRKRRDAVEAAAVWAQRMEGGSIDGGAMGGGALTPVPFLPRHLHHHLSPWDPPRDPLDRVGKRVEKGGEEVGNIIG